MNAIVIRKPGFAFAKASTSSRRQYVLRPGNELPIDDPDELFDFYKATVDDEVVYIIKEGARVTWRQTEHASSLTRYMDIVADGRERRRRMGPPAAAPTK